MQMALGTSIAADLSDLRRGNLVFWNGHVGVMLDGARLLHANAFHMEVAIEPLAEAVAHLAKSAGAITAIRRL
jgi:cell wall-associated NlpC family hydrolase